MLLKEYPEFNNNPSIVWRAVTQNGLAILYASEELQYDLDLATHALKHMHKSEDRDKYGKHITDKIKWHGVRLSALTEIVKMIIGDNREESDKYLSILPLHIKEEILKERAIEWV